MRQSVFAIRLVLIVCIAVLVPWSLAQANEASKNNARCFACHGEKGSVKKFPDGNVLSTYVDKNTLAASVHGGLLCTQCHKEFSGQSHPDRAFRSKLQYRIKESFGCRDCHPESIIRSRAVHEALFQKEGAGEAIICANCHSAHAVSPIAGGNVTNTEERYCLRCHDREKQMAFRDGEHVLVRVRIQDLRDSPHKNVGCSDCHFGFSADDHPRRRFGSERQYRIASSEICRRCHYDIYTKAAEGIHYAMLSKGKLQAPACVDCHGGHRVSSLTKDRLAIVQKCRTCHSRVYEVYAKSVHGSALLNASNKDVPICTDCHTAHTIKDPTTSGFHNTVPDTCSTCHSNAAIMGKYGLSTDVVKTYLSDFHGVSISLYRKEAQDDYQPDRPMAVCTDCHGTHGITSVSGTGKQILKQTLGKRCRTCHSNATDNFPDAWLSHYKPTLASAPLVFIVEQGYKILLPLMVIGLLFQVFLHIWRYFTGR
jgi:predicted CXXCH cytochrome family protein